VNKSLCQKSVLPDMHGDTSQETKQEVLARLRRREGSIKENSWTKQDLRTIPLKQVQFFRPGWPVGHV
jgi:hypothetical protein